MLKYAFLVTAATLPMLAAAPASAATIIECNAANCVSTDENVLLTDGTNQETVSGFTNQTNTQVFFTSDGNTLDANNGQASLSANDGLLENISVTLADGATFQTLLFNLFPLSGNNSNEATSVEIFAFGGGSQTFDLSGNGNNFFAITADTDEQLTGFRFVTGTGGVDSLRQLRFGGVTTAGAVPEPGTWAMMLLGFGAIGFGMRRRKSAEKGQRVRLAYT